MRDEACVRPGYTVNFARFHISQWHFFKPGSVCERQASADWRKVRNYQYTRGARLGCLNVESIVSTIVGTGRIALFRSSGKG